MGGNLSGCDKTAMEKSIEQRIISKVPQVTIFFWVMKILVTTIGDRAKGLLKNNLHLGLTNTSIIISFLVILFIIVQFRTKKYVPGIYWLVVACISIEGSIASDCLSVFFGIPRIIKTMLFLVLMSGSFLVWFYKERTLSIRSIVSIRSEVFYWIAILMAFALGTALGDWISEEISLNSFSLTLLFSAVLGLVSMAYKEYKLNSVIAFWAAFVFTRPFGESFVGFLTDSRHSGGLGLGTIGTIVIFLIMIVVLAIYQTKTRKDESLLLS